MAESNELQVGVRDMWRHEALNFTPWLADHLELLGEAIGLKLESVKQEQQVGSFSLDILARETDEDVTVAIENQLEWTDHGHLGQLLTYAAGCDAHIGIWVAPDFQYEHAEALHRLNEWAGTNIRFYGVKVEVVRRHDTAPLEPRLRRVVYPGGWDKGLTLPQPPPPDPEIEKNRIFFEPLIANLLGSGFADSSRRLWGSFDRLFPSSFDKEMGCVVEQRGESWVYYHLRTWESIDLCNKLFDALKSEQEEIQSSIDPQADWHWLRYDSFTFSAIGIRKDGSIDAPPETPEETRARMFDLLPKFKGSSNPAWPVFSTNYAQNPPRKSFYPLDRPH